MDKKEFLRSLEILSELRELARKGGFRPANKRLRSIVPTLGLKQGVDLIRLYCKDELKEYNQKRREEDRTNEHSAAARYFYGQQFLSEIAR